MTGPRPRIVITAGSNPGTTNHAWLRFDYLHAISKARGLPSIVAPGFTNPLDEADQPKFLQLIDAWVLEYAELYAARTR